MTKDNADTPTQAAIASEDPYFVDEEETERAYAMPATLVNRFVVHWDAYGARIAFGEQRVLENPTAYRTALALPMPSVLALYELLKKVLTDAKIPLDEEKTNV